MLINKSYFTIGFFIACLVSGLEYFHNKKILHRDIKPENLVLDEDGNNLHSINLNRIPKDN